ncbi:hypothetical protein IFM89_003266 [Coptis chinensis]|uniref:DUF4283 domain-containing protein n=1 Tax=Coptis chinensis TaxID=261450 RepID=A0A835I9C5_9MAGN|nr:hypothetical protein IFM89_003266 [Coptis chinensis]
MIADINMFYFKFINDEDKQLAIDHGPLFLTSRIFVVRPWSPAVEKYRNGIKALPIWVRLDLPKHLWMKNGIDFVSSIIGEPICMDDATARRSRISYARICVVVDTKFKFPSSITVKISEGDSADIGLECEWVREEHKFTAKQQMRWTPKKYTQTGQISCLRDKDGSPIITDGLSKDSPVILTDDVAHAQENDSTENIEPTMRGSQVVVHAEVQATNRFEVLMPEDDDNLQDAELEQSNNMEIVPFVAANTGGDKEILQEESFEKVRT